MMIPVISMRRMMIPFPFTYTGTMFHIMTLVMVRSVSPMGVGQTRINTAPIPWAVTTVLSMSINPIVII